MFRNHLRESRITREFTKPSPNRSAKLSLLLCQRAVMSWLRNSGSLSFSLVDLIGLNWLVGQSVSVGISVWSVILRHDLVNCSRL